MLPSTLVRNTQWTARLGALCYVVWGLFHVKVANDIYLLGSAQTGITQGRLYQLAAYLLCIAVFAIVVALVANWRNTQRGYWLNLCVIGWADGVWVLVVVLPGYVPLLRGLLPPAIFLAGAVLTSIARGGAR
jgi:hypothetical protein